MTNPLDLFSEFDALNGVGPEIPVPAANST